ncbi:MAG TPA: 50S ribosomal protein L22 [Patescibacteria group bacterium]
MDYRATQKFVVMSPKKIRYVSYAIKAMRPMDAVERLPFVSRRAAEPLAKVIKAAIANAKMQGAKESELIFKEIQIGEGPRLKRGRPRSRGMFHPYKKRMSHIRVVLTTKDEKVEKKEVKKETKKVKAVVKKGKK